MEEQLIDMNRSAKIEINTSTKDTEKEHEKSICGKKSHIKSIFFPISPINSRIISSIATNLQEIIDENLINLKYSYRKGDPFYSFHLLYFGLQSVLHIL